MSAANGKELSLFQRILYATGEMGVTLSPSIVVGWLLFFYTGQVDEAGNKIYIVGYGAFAAINFFGRMIDSVADPFVGYVSDRYHTRMGRRIPWVVFGAPFLTLFSIILFYPPSFPGSWANVAWLAMALAGFWFFYTAVVAPYLSLLPEITYNNDERIEVSSYMGYFDVLGMLIATVVLGVFIAAGHGRLDMLVANPEANAVDVRYAVDPPETPDGQEDPAFAIGDYFGPVNRIAMGEGPVETVVADLDGDEKRELISVNRTGSISLRRGLGQGELGEHQEYPMGQAPQSLAVSDLNIDGFLDAVTANSGSNDISIRLGGKDGFGPVMHVPMGAQPVQVITAYLNKDEILDVVTANQGDGTMSVRLGNGDGTFGEVTALPVDSQTTAVAADDLNDDKQLELVAGSLTDGDVVARLGGENAKFTYAAKFSMGGATIAVAATDLNLDGPADLVALDATTGKAWVRYGTGDGNFEEPQGFALSAALGNLYIRDVNFDDLKDIVTVDRSNGAVIALLAQEDGTYGEAQTLPMSGAGWSVTVADLDGGGLNVGPFHFSDGYKLAAWVFGIAMMLFFWLSVVFVREKPHNPAKDVPFKFWEAFRHCLQNPAFIPYVFSVSFFRVAVDILVAMIPFMVTVIMGYKENIAGLLQGGIVLAALPLFAVVYKAAAKYGKKQIFLLSQLVFAVCLPLLVTMKHFPIFGWLANAIAGGDLSEGVVILIHLCVIFLFATFPIAAVFVLPRAVFADIIDLDHERTGYRREAMYNGMEGLLTKFAAGIATVVAPLLLMYGGDTVDHPWGILLAGPVAGVFLLFGYVAFRTYPIEK
jgi:Na+/melibiose symporter-like transporter